MKSIITKVFCFIFLLTTLGLLRAQNRVQVWADEFNGTAIDRSIWTFGEGPTNDNIHYYTDRAENARLIDGKLQLIAHEESYEGFNYTAALIRSQHTLNWRYGRIEASIKLPATNGFVPAFWMLPEDNLYGWWPQSGEIDIMEHPTNEIDKIYGTVHTDAYNSFTGSGPRGGSIQIPTAETEFHLYAIEWTPEKIDFFVDDQNYFTFHNDNGGFETWPFDQPFYIILNIAVGGGWVGAPNEQTVFPAVMEVDYVRVYQDIKDISIYGPDFLMQESKAISYFAPAIDGVNYTWSVAGGAEIVSGQNTSNIEVDWGIFSDLIKLEIASGENFYTKELAVQISSNYLKNSGFETGTKYWNKAGSFLTEADFVLTTDHVHTGEQALSVDVKTPGANPWDAQLSQSDIPLNAGQQYQISFWAKTDDQGSEINAAIINSTNFSVYELKTISLTNTWMQYNLELTAPENATASLNIDMGGHIGRYYFDDFVLTSPEFNNLNQVRNADFSAGSDGWIINTLWPAQATGTVQNGEYAIAITQGGNNPWDVFVGQENFTLERGKMYTVSFDAYAAAPREISALVGKNSEPWTVYSGNNIFALTTTKQTYTYTFVMNEPTDNQARLGFDIGSSDTDVFLDNVFLDRGSFPTSTLENASVSPQTFKLFQNSPNPFNAGTKIQFELPRDTFVKLAIFDITGQQVTTLLSTMLTAGTHSVHWNSANFASGVYFYKITTPHSSEIKKMTLIK